MSLEFERPVGADADAKELEYISALHQTGDTIRQDASIKDVDIVHFLSSRYGIRATPDQVQRTILNGMGGGDEDCIDLMEMVAILFIPTLLKAASKESTQGLVDPPPDLLDKVVNMILHDITGDATPKVLTPGLLKLIFTKYDEHELAANDDLIRDMVEAATEGKRGGTFNAETFARALTYDVQLYDYKSENKFSINSDEIFSSHTKRRSLADQHKVTPVDEEAAVSVVKEEEGIERLKTFSAIDFVAGTYKSKLLVLCLWSTFLVNSFSYYFRIDFSFDCPNFGSSFGGNVGAFACTLANNVLVWLAKFLILGSYGVLFIGLGSVGNSNRVKNAFRPLIGMLVIACFTFLPIIFRDDVLRGFDGRLLEFASFVLGSGAIILHFKNFLGLLIPSLETNRSWKKLLSPGSIAAESRARKAAANKISSMAGNALEVVGDFDEDNVVDSFFGQALLTFSKKGVAFEPSGGIAWTFRRVWSGDIFTKEGIYYSARFLASNFAQWILVLLIPVVGVFATLFVVSEYDANRDLSSNVSSLVKSLLDTALETESIANLMVLFEEVATAWVAQFLVFSVRSGAELSCDAVEEFAFHQIDDACAGQLPTSDCPFLQSSDAVCDIITLAIENANNTALTSEDIAELSSDIDLLNETEFDFDLLFSEVANAVGNATAQAIDSLYPDERYMVILPFAIAALVATITAFGTAIVYVPSVTSTVIKLRSGLIPTLTNEDFVKYRHKVNHITLISGSMFWGVFFSSLLLGTICGAVVFFAVWQVTRNVALRVLALVLGIGITILLRWTFNRYIRSFWRAFYRMEPAPSNVVNVATESSNFAVSIAFVWTRIVKLVAVAFLYVGRLDTFFLAPGVGDFGLFDLDTYPKIFLTDILTTEAHRHPYLDLLGTMYLMKLKYNEEFGKTAGSSWRLIFVTALMPWLQKYRILLRSGGFEDVDDETLTFSPSNMDADDATIAVVKEVTDDHGNKRHQTVYVPPAPLRPRVSQWGTRGDQSVFFDNSVAPTRTRPRRQGNLGMAQSRASRSRSASIYPSAYGLDSLNGAPRRGRRQSGGCAESFGCPPVNLPTLYKDMGHV